MKALFNSLSEKVRRYWPIFRSGGPVALGQAMRLASLEGKIKKRHDMLDAEEALHERTVESIRQELNDLTGRYEAVRVAQVHFVRYVDKTNDGGSRTANDYLVGQEKPGCLNCWACTKDSRCGHDMVRVSEAGWCPRWEPTAEWAARNPAAANNLGTVQFASGVAA